jgi:hypothetical protein
VRGGAQLVNVSTETDAAPTGKSVWVAEMYGYALGAAKLGLRHRGVNNTNHHPPGDPILRAAPGRCRVAGADALPWDAAVETAVLLRAEDHRLFAGRRCRALHVEGTHPARLSWRQSGALHQRRTLCAACAQGQGLQIRLL